MSRITPKGWAAVVQSDDLSVALDILGEQVREWALPARGAELAVLFAGSAYASAYPELLSTVRQLTKASVIIGCSGQGVIGKDSEIEGDPALSLLALSLPGAYLKALHINQSDLENCRSVEDWRQLTGASEEAVNNWLLFVDPFTLDAEGMLAFFSAAYPAAPLVGGLASGELRLRKTYLFLDEDLYDSGAVALALGGDYAIRTVVSQGCMPIGQAWTITSANGNCIESIAQRPALEVLVETLQGLSPELQERAGRNLLVGFAMNEYKDEFRRGDFLIRNLLAIDKETGALVVGTLPRVGQTLQFQLRDPDAADEDLRELLARTKLDLNGEKALGAILCSCNGRGVGLFGVPDHDARVIQQMLGLMPLAGFFCNGEIGPVGQQNFLHGFTASLGLIVRAGQRSRAS
ncbi:MAG TPA: FIST N-terminal domain-containing protein [Dehalococcoidia bacterium]|nr:FIST N-terminal domain-containing protein [Dehalococcoidia bacterium]